MSPRAKRILRWVVVGLFVPIIIGALLLWYGLSSESVARRLISMGLARAGDRVRVGQVSGSIGGPLILRDVRVKTTAMAARIDSLLLDWTPAGLIHRQVRVDRLHLTGLHVVLPDSAPRDTAVPKRPELPIDVALGDLRVRDLSVDAPGGMTLRNGSARVTGRAEDYQLVARGEATLRGRCEAAQPTKQSGRVRPPDCFVAAAPRNDGRAGVQFELNGRGNLEQLLLDRAAVQLLDGAMSAAGRVSWWPRVSWNLAARASDLRPAPRGRVSLRARTDGFLDSAGAHGRLEVDRVSGALRGQPLGGTAAVRFAGTTLDIGALDARWGSARLLASGTVAESLDLRFRSTVGALSTAVPGARGSLRAAGSVTGPRTAARVRATFSGRNVAYGANGVARLAGRADVGLAEDGRTDLGLRGHGARLGARIVDSLAVALRGTRTAHRLRLRADTDRGDLDLAAGGGLKDRRWRGSIDSLTLTSTPAGDWRLERPAALSAAAGSAALDTLCLSADSARACAAGRWRGARSWQAAAAVERLPLALADSLLPDSLVPGRRIAGTASGRLQARTVAGRMTGGLRMRLDGASLSYQLPTDTAPERILVDTAAAELVAGADGVRGWLGVRFVGVDGSPVGTLAGSLALPGYTRLGQPLDRQRLGARLDGRVDDLSLARAFDRQLDSITGTITLSASVDGTAGAPRVNGDFLLQDLAAWLSGSRVARGAVRAKLAGAVGEGRRFGGELAVVPRGVVYEYALAGIPQRIVVDSGGMTVRAGKGGVQGRLALGLRDSAGARLASFTGRLELPRYTTLGAPLAPQPMRVELAGDLPDISFFRALTGQFDSLAGRMRFDLGATGTVAAPRVAGQMRITELAARVPDGGVVTGGIESDLTAVVASDSRITGALRLVPRRLAFVVLDGEATRTVTLADTGLVVRVGRDGLRGTLDLELAASGKAMGAITGRMSVPRYTRVGLPLDSLPVTAELKGRVDDLALVQAFTPQIDSLAGRFTVDATMGGTLADPALAGGFRLDADAARLPLLGVLYRDVRLSAIANRSGALDIDGRLRSGRGTLTIGGTAPLSPSAEQPARLRVQGENFEALDIPELHAVVSPDLDIVVAGDSIDADGEVTLPLARVRLSDIPELAVPPSDDVIFVDESTARRPPAWRIASRIRVVLGDSVSFTGFNFNAELGGRLLLVQQPEEPPIGSGTIVIEEGRYKAYGQDLTISQGRIRFAGGPVDNPALDIQATRTVDDTITAGLQIRGTLKSPAVTIFSNPPMSETRALAYIVLGRPPGEGSGTDASLIEQAASSLGLRGGNLLATTIGRNIGLSDAGIESEGDFQQASFVAGKYLAPNLYVSYGIGLFDPTSILRLRYDLSRRWTLQGERGASTGADLLFKTERGTNNPADTKPRTGPATARSE